MTAVSEHTFGLVSLGCAKNLVDSEVMMGSLVAEGWRQVEDLAQAEVLIVNTCGFIKAAKEESIDTILDLVEYKQQKCRLLVVAGCLVQKYHAELEAELPEVDIFLGTSDFAEIVAVVKKALGGPRFKQISAPNYLYDHLVPRQISTPKHSVYIKVADGCSNRCSYCVIPDFRGNYRSRELESIVEEAKGLVANGAKEVMLIAQDTTAYGLDRYGKPMLVELIKQLTTIPNLHWLRILYCYPTHFTDELLEEIATNPKVCKYLDIPLQHCNTEILKQMHRKGTKDDLVALLAKIRSRIPNIVLRTSFIVGFPGESQSAFEELADFIKQVKFDRLGVFTYSQEEETPAGVMENQIDEAVKQERFDVLMALQHEIAYELNQKYIDQVLEVLIEETSESQVHTYIGRTYGDAPEIDNVVLVHGENLKLGEFYKVRINEAYAYDLIGEVDYESSK